MSNPFTRLGLALAGCALVAACGGGDPYEAEGNGGGEAVASQQSELLSSDCTGIRPDGPGPRITNQITIGEDRDCLGGTSDRLGHMALGIFDVFGEDTSFRVQEETGGPTLGVMGGYQLFDIFPNISSFQAMQAYPDATVYLNTWNHNGTFLSSQRLDLGSLDSSRDFRMASDFGGGVAFVYRSRDNFHNHFSTVRMQRFFQDGPARHASVIVASSPNLPMFIAVGVNWYRNTLVLYDGMMEGMGYGHIAAAWFDNYGNRLTSAFDVGTLASPDTYHALDLFPLYDGRMALRVDGTWKLIIPMSPGPGTAPPAWLASHPNMDLHFIRGYRGYALVPATMESVPACFQRFYLYAQNGNYCGSVTFGVDSSPCLTNDIDLGNDGTVIQVLPSNHESCSDGHCTCTRYIYRNVLQ